MRGVKLALRGGRRVDEEELDEVREEEAADEPEPDEEEEPADELEEGDEEEPAGEADEAEDEEPAGETDEGPEDQEWREKLDATLERIESGQRELLEAIGLKHRSKPKPAKPSSKPHERSPEKHRAKAGDQRPKPRARVLRLW